MVSNSSLPVKVDFSDSEADMTPYGGVELWLRSAMPSGAFRDLPAGTCREQRWTHRQMLLSLWLLDILGYDCLEDVDRLEEKRGFLPPGWLTRGAETWGVAPEAEAAPPEGADVSVAALAAGCAARAERRCCG